MAWFGLEGTFRDYLVPGPRQEQLPLNRVTQTPIQRAFGPDKTISKNFPSIRCKQQKEKAPDDKCSYVQKGLLVQTLLTQTMK